MPIEGLRLEEEVVEALRTLRIDRVGDLLRLDRDALPARFGEMLARRLDEARGVREELLHPVRPTSPRRMTREFPSPLRTREGLRLAVAALLAESCESLRRRERGVVVLQVAAFRVDHGRGEVRLSLGRPSRRAGHLWSLLEPRLEEIALGEGLERIEVTMLRTALLPRAAPMIDFGAVGGTHARSGDAAECCDASDANHASRARDRTHAKQVDSGDSGDSMTPREEDAATAQAVLSAAAELADGLESRLGRGSVRRIVPVEGHLPEWSARSIAWSEGSTAPTSGVRWSASLRPTLLRESPDPIVVEMARGERRCESRGREAIEIEKALDADGRVEAISMGRVGSEREKVERVGGEVVGVEAIEIERALDADGRVEAISMERVGSEGEKVERVGGEVAGVEAIEIEKALDADGRVEAISMGRVGSEGEKVERVGGEVAGVEAIEITGTDAEKETIEKETIEKETIEKASDGSAGCTSDQTAAPSPPRIAAILWLGRRRRVIDAIGPEWIGEAWWRIETTAPVESLADRLREYWRTRLEGGLWVWIYRDAAQDRWFLHGVWA